MSTMGVLSLGQASEAANDTVPATTESKSKGKEDAVEGTQYEEVWKKKTEEAIEEEFQKDLRVRVYKELRQTKGIKTEESTQLSWY